MAQVAHPVPQPMRKMLDRNRATFIKALEKDVSIIEARDKKLYGCIRKTVFRHWQDLDIGWM